MSTVCLRTWNWPVVVLDVAPHAVQVNRVRHHRVVDEHDAQALAVGEPQRLGVRELDAVERPREPLHVAGQVQLDRPAWLAAVGIVERRSSDRRRSARAGRCRAGRCPDRRAATSASSSACRRADCRSRSPDAAASAAHRRHVVPRMRIRGHLCRHVGPAADRRRADPQRDRAPRRSVGAAFMSCPIPPWPMSAIVSIGRDRAPAPPRAGLRAPPACRPRSRCDPSTARRS